MEIFHWIVGGFWHFIAFLLVLNAVFGNLSKIVIRYMELRYESKNYCHGCKLKEK